MSYITWLFNHFDMIAGIITAVLTAASAVVGILVNNKVISIQQAAKFNKLLSQGFTTQEALRNVRMTVQDVVKHPSITAVQTASDIK